MGRVIRGNLRRVVALIFGPDAWSVQAASLGQATNTWSPMSAGTSPRGRGQYTGDPGFGVNRMAGRTLPPQHYAAVTAPITDPSSYALGYGAGTSGQPGMPQTGLDVVQGLGGVGQSWGT
jgi:hypothetical protein